MLSLENFKPIELESKTEFERHYEKYAPLHSDNSFSTMLSWRDYANYEYMFYNDSLCIKTTVDGLVQFRMPLGKQSKELFDMLLYLARKENLEEPFGLIENDGKKWLEDNFNDLEFIPAPEYFDYVYLSSNLSSLEGSKYAKIRNRLNKFKKNHDYSIEPIQEDNIGEVKQFLKRWCIWRDCEEDPLLSYERKAINYSTDHFIDLNLSGIAVEVDGNIEAISIFESLNPDTVVVHFEKGSADFDGIYKLVNNETAKLVEKDFMFINRESDMGNPGLRKAKKSYRPHHMVEVYKLKD